MSKEVLVVGVRRLHGVFYRSNLCTIYIRGKGLIDRCHVVYLQGGKTTLVGFISNQIASKFVLHRNRFIASLRTLGRVKVGTNFSTFSKRWARLRSYTKLGSH